MKTTLCGVIAFKGEEEMRRYLLVRQDDGSWFFPVGAYSEQEKAETAVRCILNELIAPLSVEIDSEFCETYHRNFSDEDHTAFYLVKCPDDTEALRHSNARFVSLEDAGCLMEWDHRASLLKAAEKHLYLQPRSRASDYEIREKEKLRQDVQSGKEVILYRLGTVDKSDTLLLLYMMDKEKKKEWMKEDYHPRYSLSERYTILIMAGEVAHMNGGEDERISSYVDDLTGEELIDSERLEQYRLIQNWKKDHDGQSVADLYMVMLMLRHEGLSESDYEILGDRYGEIVTKAFDSIGSDFILTRETLPILTERMLKLLNVYRDIRDRYCGAIVYSEDDCRRYLLVKQKNGMWTFPQGHLQAIDLDEAENEDEAVRREVEEQASMYLIFMKHGFKETEEYSVPGSGRTQKKTICLAEYISFSDDARQDVRCQSHKVCDACFITAQEAADKLDHENERELLRRAERFLEDEKADEEFCRGADRVLDELKDLELEKGMKSLDMLSTDEYHRVFLYKNGMSVYCTNGRHNICISITPTDLDCSENCFEVSAYYAAIADRYPDEQLCVSFGEPGFPEFSRPALSVSVPYSDTYPEAEELRTAIDLLTEKMRIYEPVIRAVAEGKPVPRDGSEASVLYYDVYLQSDQYRDISKKGEENE